MAIKLSGLEQLAAVRDELAKSARERERLAKLAREQALAREREANVFKHAVEDVDKIKSTGRKEHKLPAALPNPTKRLEDEQHVLEQSLSDEFSLDTLLETDESLSFARPGVGADVLKKLRRRHWTIQAQLDLHGLRTEEARETLATFLRESVKSGYRCVRVIHGKGLGSRDKMPVLKSKVRSWLVQKDNVLAFVSAPPHDGGAGALIVLLAGSPGKPGGLVKA